MRSDKSVLFIHDGPRWENPAGHIFGTHDDIELRKRYSYLGKKVDFMMRLHPLPVGLSARTVRFDDLHIQLIPVVPFNRPRYLLNYFKARSQIIKAVTKYDILVIRLPSTIGSLALKLAQKKRIPYITEVVACPWNSLIHHSLLGILYAPFSYLKLKKLVKRAPYVIYVTNKFLQSRYPAKGRFTGISDVMLDPVTDPILDTKLIRYRKLTHQPPIVLATIGAVNVKYKGQDLVIKAMAQLKREGYKFRYHLIGGGHDKRLRDIARNEGVGDEVICEGLVKHNHIFSILDRVDIYIQPSFTEGLPRSVIEAMSRGCVCIGSDAGGIPELLDRTLIFKKGDLHDLVRTMRQISDHELLLHQSRRNFQYAELFEKSTLDQRRNEFYSEFLRNLKNEVIN